LISVYLHNEAAEMKRRTIKKLLRREEKNLGNSLKGLLTNANSETYAIRLRELSSALTYLLGVHLQLDSAWDHKHRWLDDVEWSSLSSSGMTLEGNGKIWWGYRMRPTDALVPVEFEARLQLWPTPLSCNVAYQVTFEEDGVKFCVSSRDVRC
jgi:hypothetical protein